MLVGPQFSYNGLIHHLGGGLISLCVTAPKLNIFMFDFELFKSALEKHVIFQKHIDFEISTKVLLGKTQQRIYEFLV